MTYRFIVYCSKESIHGLVKAGVNQLYLEVEKKYNNPQIIFWNEYFKGEHLIIVIKEIKDYDWLRELAFSIFQAFLLKHPSIKSTTINCNEDLFIDYPNNRVMDNNHHYTDHEIKEMTLCLTSSTASFTKVILLLIPPTGKFDVETRLEIVTDLLFSLIRNSASLNLEPIDLINDLIYKFVKYHRYINASLAYSQALSNAEKLFNGIKNELIKKYQENINEPLLRHSLEANEKWNYEVKMFLHSMMSLPKDSQVENLKDLYLLITIELGLGSSTGLFPLYWAGKMF